MPLNMPPYTYRITVGFAWPNWPFIYAQVFGDAQHSYSQVCDSEPTSIYGFDTPQTPVDLGPLVKVEIIDTPSL